MKKLILSISILLILAGNIYPQQWDKDVPAGTVNVSDVDYYVENNQVSLDRLLAGYNTISLVYNSASQITASAGEVVVANSDGSVRLFLRNTSATTVAWTDIDTGSEAASTTYYVYAIAAAASSETATFKISTSATAPTGITYYKKIGSFYNDADSDIDRKKVYTTAYGTIRADSSGKKSIQAIYDYGTSASSYTFKDSDLKFAFGRKTLSSGSATISNLPFTSASSFACTVTRYSAGDVSQALQINARSASSIGLRDSQGGNNVAEWQCIGY